MLVRAGISLLLKPNSKILQHLFKLILRGEAGVKKVAALVVPLGEAAVVEHFVALVDDKGDDVMLEALLEHEEAPDSAVAVLEGVNALEAHVKGDDILKGDGFKGVIIGDQ